jgi:hypothetical protein
MLERERWVVIADDNKILCRAMNCYIFKPIDKIESTSVVTFGSSSEASIILRMYTVDFDSKNYKIVKVTERIEVI